MLHSLSLLQKDVINYIIAANEGSELPQSQGAVYMQAFAGGFQRGMPFTCYMPLANKVILYVAEEGANCAADRRSAFNQRCERLKVPLLGAAHFVNELVEGGYIRGIEKGGREEYREEYGVYWRRYEAFYMEEIEELGCVCSHWFVPRLKLYKLKGLLR